MGATRSFISHGSFCMLNLKVSIMKYVMIIDTSVSGYVATTLVYLNCLLSIYGRDFGVDLIYLLMNSRQVY